ncbi:MAG TPA: aldo/keto reductase [Acidobacteriota bacterium]|nr:aldo/keto reductase [Acidobacteriota bacterium]
MRFSASRRQFLGVTLAAPVVSIPAGRVGLAAVQESPPEMEYRELGSTGLKVTALGFGCMLTSDPSVIERAVDVGINYFDTARGYQRGNNERMVGAALKPVRSKVILGTKSGAATAEGLRADLETSLRELGTDYVDIWYLHSKDSISQVSDELLEVMARAKEEGKIRFAGVSTHSGQKALLPALAENPQIDVILTAYNFTMDEEMKQAVATARRSGKGIVAMKVMAGGFRRAGGESPLRDKLQRPGAFVAALKWVLKDPNVDTAIPSITDMQQLEENLSALREPFSGRDEELLAGQLEAIRPFYCRMCGECSGRCPGGVPVQEVLRILTYAEGYGQFPLARERYLELEQQVQVGLCDLCPECRVVCPHGIQVAERMRKARELLA